MSLMRRIMRLRKRRENSAGKKRIRKVFLEPLEPRLLLSADLKFAMGGAADDLTLRLDNDDGAETLKLINNDDLSILASQALDETSSVEISGSGDADTLTIDFDFGLGNLLETIPISFIDSSVGDSDTLEILGPDVTWNITGADIGTVGDVDFLQLLDNWRQLLRYELGRERLEADLRQTLADLEQAVGGWGELQPAVMPEAEAEDVAPPVAEEPAETLPQPAR